MALPLRICACCVLPLLYRYRTASSSFSANIILTAIFHNGEDPLGELDIMTRHQYSDDQLLLSPEHRRDLHPYGLFYPLPKDTVAQASTSHRGWQTVNQETDLIFYVGITKRRAWRLSSLTFSQPLPKVLPKPRICGGRTHLTPWLCAGS